MSDSETKMTAETFQRSVEQDETPPSGASGPLAALWHAGKGDYERAHALIESDTSKEAAWVRAHLHRRKGEHERAAEWYRAAGRDPSTQQVDQEWTEIASGVLLNV